MSEYWGLHCKTCDMSTDHDFNHGEEILRGLVRATPYVKEALDADKSGYLEFSIMGHHWSNVIRFAVWDHVGHELEIESEYGYTEPIEEEQKEGTNE